MKIDLRAKVFEHLQRLEASQDVRDQSAAAVIRMYVEHLEAIPEIELRSEESPEEIRERLRAQLGGAFR